MVYVMAAATLLSGCNSEQREAERAVSDRMRDPGSTQFKDVARCSADPNIWHGSFNAKNGFGAYSGFDPFYYENFRVVLLGDSDFSSFTDRCFRQSSEETGAADAAVSEAIAAASMAAAGSTPSASPQPSAKSRAKAAPLEDIDNEN